MPYASSIPVSRNSTALDCHNRRAAVHGLQPVEGAKMFARIGDLLGERAAGTPSVVVSSLSLRNLWEDERDAIIRESLDVLPRGGAIVQFTYARHPAIACELLEVECQRVGFAPLNVPPASVWRIRRLRGQASRRRTETDGA